MKSVYWQKGVKAYFDEDELPVSPTAVLAHTWARGGGIHSPGAGRHPRGVGGSG